MAKRGLLVWILIVIHLVYFLVYGCSGKDSSTFSSPTTSTASASPEITTTPPHVRNYITVPDYDKSLSLALKKGAKLIHEAVVPNYCMLGVLEIPGDLYLAVVELFKGHP